MLQPRNFQYQYQLMCHEHFGCKFTHKMNSNFLPFHQIECESVHNVILHNKASRIQYTYFETKIKKQKNKNSFSCFILSIVYFLSVSFSRNSKRSYYLISQLTCTNRYLFLDNFLFLFFSIRLLQFY